ncbi:putative methyltransferase type 11 [Mycobacterium xenopi 4042]|uniref:Putative methyltransferase type 11 n=1 Tax=Mycobacterium xenopi 4042 TaxID=1299334 RepID=X8AAJ4_MYCXE|nr:putative methyltransferase type 11 [Mycobacterium xenopi 4042]
MDGGDVVKLNAIERALMNNPVRAALQHRNQAEWFRRLADGSLSGQKVLEVGCGRASVPRSFWIDSAPIVSPPSTSMN